MKTEGGKNGAVPKEEFVSRLDRALPVDGVEFAVAVEWLQAAVKFSTQERETRAPTTTWVPTRASPDIKKSPPKKEPRRKEDPMAARLAALDRQTGRVPVTQAEKIEEKMKQAAASDSLNDRISNVISPSPPREEPQPVKVAVAPKISSPQKIVKPQASLPTSPPKPSFGNTRKPAVAKKDVSSGDLESDPTIQKAMSLKSTANPKKEERPKRGIDAFA